MNGDLYGMVPFADDIVMLEEIEKYLEDCLNIMNNLS